MSQSNSTKENNGSEILSEAIDPRFAEPSARGIRNLLFTFNLNIIGLVDFWFPKALAGSFLGTQSEDEKLSTIFQYINSKLEKIQNGVSETKQNLEALSRGMSHMTEWQIALDTLDQYLKPINNLYTYYLVYEQFRKSVKKQTILEFAKSVTSHSTNSIQTLMANVNSMIVPSNPPPPIPNMKIENLFDQLANEKRMDKYLAKIPKWTKFRRHVVDPILRSGVFELLDNALENYNDCHYTESPQHLIYGMYTLLFSTLSKGFLMVYFSYEKLSLNNAGNFSLEMGTARHLYEHYILNLYKAGIPSVNKASNGFKRCEPLNHVEKKTFIMVKELIQGYFVFENDLLLSGNNDPYFSSPSYRLWKWFFCSKTCEYYKSAQDVSCSFRKNDFCTRNKQCKGKLYDCKKFEERAEVCFSDIPYRRYDWIKNTEKTLGKQGDCDNKKILILTRELFAYCYHCVCLCDDPDSETTVRTLSLRPSLSNIAEGKVVTGVRFIELNRVFHIQVQEGTALPEGKINSSTIKWVKVDLTLLSCKCRELKDFVTLGYYERILDLDKFEAPKDYFITGVKFFITKETHFSFAIFVTKINYTTGVLSPKQSYWINADNSTNKEKGPRTEIKLKDPDDPRYSKSSSDLFSESNTFIKFQPTSMYKDVSQLTVPFFDAQPVQPIPSKWIEGLQMYHRGSEGYGGFIGLKVFSYNIKLYRNQN